MFDTLETIFRNMLNGVIAFVPSLFSALVVLLIGWIIARVVRYIIERVGKLFRFDSIVERTGLASNLSEKRTPTQIAGIFIFWLIFLNFLLTAFDILGLSQAVEPLRALIAFLPQLIVGFILLIIGALLARFIADAVEVGVSNMGIEFGKAIAGAVRIILLGIVVIIVVQQMGIEAQLLSDVFTYVVVVLLAGMALAFGLGGRSVVRNVLAGFYARELYVLGDTVLVEGEEGTLEGIGTLNSEITLNDERLVVPNTHLTEKVVRVRTPSAE